MKTMKYLSMVAIALMGAVMTSCSSNDDITNELPQQPENKDIVETLTASLSWNSTRALTPEGVKTFSEGDKIAVVYTNTSGTKVKAESVALTTDDIADGTSANFTVTLTNADKTKNVTYIYPAAMAKSDGTVNYDALASQDGTLESLAQNLDYCEFSGAWNGALLPTGNLENQLVVCAFTLKNNAGGAEITSNVTTMTVSDGTNVYIVNRTAAAGPIYVAIKPIDGKTLKYTAIANSKVYTKEVSSKIYDAGDMRPLGLLMTQDDNMIPGLFSVGDTKVYFSKGNLRASGTVSGSTTTWTWAFATNQWDRIGGRSNGGSETPSGNNNITASGKLSSTGNVDLFGWSTDETYLGIHKTNDNNAEYEGAFVDWGSHPDVIAGIGTGWRTLTSDEWRHLMSNRAGNRFAKAQVRGTRGGFILLPDNWDTKNYTLNNINNAGTAYTANSISNDDWSPKLEAHGAVFLPVTGQRNGSNYVNGYNDQLHYWSASKNNTDTGKSANATHLRYMPSGEYAGLAPDAGAGRCNGFAVRLVRDVK